MDETPNKKNIIRMIRTGEDLPLLMEGKVPPPELVEEIAAESAAIRRVDGVGWLIKITGKNSVNIPDEYVDAYSIATHQLQFYANCSSLSRINGKKVFKQGLIDYLMSYMVYMNILLSMSIDELECDKESPRLLFHFALLMVSTSHLLDGEAHASLKRLHGYDWDSMRKGDIPEQVSKCRYLLTLSETTN
ncbi:hypothetical protein HYDPIDRAFT_35122 [Hydnomerulius pinastri MD-312]|uniref:Uncharacterized protein n=1 Tax=Hydnomerulius pinastri MD-312 TaxID=994086 RepID=A0A0C2PQY9_9AGAM|nr:hypothetical protein HYDPIDRAFT_35122 [Hydnomerulius pinastri MD-312]